MTGGSLLRWKELLGALGAQALLVAGQGLFTTITPFFGASIGLSILEISTIQSFHYIGFIFGALINRTIVEKIGFHRGFVGYTALATIFIMAFFASKTAVILCAMRMGIGFALVGVYISIESLLNHNTENAVRGRLFGIYQTIIYFSLAMGQLLLMAGTPGNPDQLLITATLFISAIVPITLLPGWTQPPADVTPARKQDAERLLQTFISIKNNTSTAFFRVLLCGILSGTFYTTQPIFLQFSGFSTHGLALLLTASLLAALAIQWPAGWLSDRYGRHLISYRMAVLSTLISLMLMFSSGKSLISILTVLYSMSIFCQYGLNATYIYDRTSAQERITASSLLLMIFSVGGAMGPLLAGLAISSLGTVGINIINFITALCLATTIKRSSPSTPNH